MLIKHSAFYFLGRIIPGIVSLVALALYTRLLTTDQYGHYALVIAAVSFVNAVCFQWLNLSLGRFLPAKENEPQALISTALTGFLLLVALTGVLGGALAWLWPDRTLRWFIILAIVIGWAQAWFDLNLKILNVLFAPIRYGLVASAKAILALSLGLAFFYLGLGVVGILVGLMIGLLIPTLVALKQWHDSSVRHYNVRLLKDFIAYGAPLTVTFMLTLVLDISDRFLLGWFINADAVGAYAAAYDLTQQSVAMLMGVVHLAAFPLAVHALEHGGLGAAKDQLKTNLLLLLSVALPATVGIILLADNIAFTFLGPAFRGEAKAIIPLIALAVFVWGIKSYYLDYAFQLTRRTRTQVWPVLCAALINVCLNIFWIPAYGLSGAVFATLAAILAGALIAWHQARQIFSFPPMHREIYKIFIASAAMACWIVLSDEWRGATALVSQITVGVVVYVALLIVLNTHGTRSRFKDWIRLVAQRATAFRNK